MAENDRYGYSRDRFRGREDEGRERGRDRLRGDQQDDGSIARRGFGNSSAGYDRGNFERQRSVDAGRSGFERGGSFRDDERHHRSRERDFGDSAGYGSGGSTRDWRDVMGDERHRDTGYDQSRERGFAGGYGAGPVGGREDLGRHGASDFGRGSRSDQDDRGFFERVGDGVRSWFGEEQREMPGGRQGDVHHRGRGPKNYARSDDRIREDVNDRLTDDPHVDASEIDVLVQNREVTLTGTVNSRFEKRHAEDIAERVSGVTHVQNNLRVMQSGMASNVAGGSMAPGTGSGMETGAGPQAGTAHHGTASIGTTDDVVGGATGTGLGGKEVSIPDESASQRGRRR